MSDIVNALQPTELDKAAEAFIQETASEFKSDELDEVINAVPDGASNTDGNGVAPAEGQAPQTPEQVAAPVAEAGQETPSNEPAYERLVAREVALLEREKAIKTQEAKYAEYENTIKQLQSRVVPEDWQERMETEPDVLLQQMGFDPEQMVRRVIARRLEAQGKEVPENLRQELRTNAEKLADRKRIQALEARLAQQEHERQARAYFDEVSNGAREYVTKGISDKLPTVASVAKRNPDWVHMQIMEVISRDAQQKAARDPGAPLLSYSDAAGLVEQYLTNIRSVLTPEEAKMVEASSPAKPNTPNVGAKNGQPPVTQPQGAPKVVQPPEKPLAPWLQKPETEDEGLKAALMEYRRVEKLGS